MWIRCFLNPGRRESQEENTISIAIRAAPDITVRVEEILNENPNFANPETNNKYSIKLIESDSNVEYKILQVTPDPRYHYEI